MLLSEEREGKARITTIILYNNEINVNKYADV